MVVPTTFSVDASAKLAANKTVKRMKVITIESEAYKALTRKIDGIARYIKESKQNAPLIIPEPDPNEVWIGNIEASEMLQISTRTLQRLRTAGEITYFIKGGKVQYTLAEVKRLMPGRMVTLNRKEVCDE